MTAVAFDVVRVVLPTQFGEFDVTAFEVRPGLVYLALARGDLTDGGPCSPACTRSA